MKTQSEAVINFLVNLAEEKGYNVSPKEDDYATVLTQDDKALCVDFITKSIEEGSVSMKEASLLKHDTTKKLHTYVVGLVNDRIRKAKDLNGNVTYKFKEPGKLKNSRDPELKALMQVLTLDNPPEVKAEIQAEIDRRRKEISKPTTVEIDISKLPLALRISLGYEVE